MKTVYNTFYNMNMNQSYDAKSLFESWWTHLIQKNVSSFYDLSLSCHSKQEKILKAPVPLPGRDVVAAAMALFFAAPQARADVGEGKQECVET